jgi:hypothetical protein
MQLLLSPMNQQMKVLFEAKDPVLQFWGNPSKMPVISDLPYILGCHYEDLHEHWFSPVVLPLCDDLQSIT